MPNENKPAITTSSLARMAGNIASGMCPHDRSELSEEYMKLIAERSVRLARLIAAEVELK